MDCSQKNGKQVADGIFFVYQRNALTQRYMKLDWNSLYLPICSMEQSPSSEAKLFVACQKIPRILLNPNVHYRIHKYLPNVPILNQLDQVHIPTSHLLP